MEYYTTYQLKERLYKLELESYPRKSLQWRKLNSRSWLPLAFVKEESQNGPPHSSSPPNLATAHALVQVNLHVVGGECVGTTEDSTT